MPLTPAQKTALKADIAANTNTIPVGQPWTNSFANAQINAIPNDSGGNATIAGWYSQVASPDFNVLRSNVPTDDIYDAITWANYTPQDVPDNTVTYQNRAMLCQTKQINLQLLLQGRTTFNAGKLTQRSGLNDATTNLPSGASGASRSGGWTAILPILRRLALRIEKLFAVQTSGVGVVNAGDLGATTNPALLIYEGTISGDDVEQARNLP